MKEFAEKLIGRFEEQAEQYRRRGFEHEEKGYSAMADKYYGKQCSYLHSIEIVNELAEEYNNGWISVEERLPEKEGSYLVIGKTGGARVTRWYPPSQFYPNGHFGGNSANYIRYWMKRPKAPIREEEG